MAQVQNQSCIIVLLVGSDMKDIADPDTKSVGGLTQYLLTRLCPLSSHSLSPQLLVKQWFSKCVQHLWKLVRNANSYFRHIEPVILGMGCVARSPGGSDAHSLLSAPRQLAFDCFMKGDIYPSQLRTSHSEPDTVFCPQISNLLVLLPVLVQINVFLIWGPADFSLASPLCVLFVISVFRAKGVCGT